VEDTLDGNDRRVLQLSMLPVYVVHDECLFIRVLQSFETTFSRIAVLLRAAANALGQGDAGPALDWIERAELSQSEAAPLFSLLATMQVESFRTFRAFTEGASAIQSRSYKTVESLCRMPEQTRLDSLAYRSVPEVRERVLAGQATLEDALERVVRAQWLSAGEHTALAQAMGRFAETLLRWRETHYRLAVRMLGERPGTGYTEGTPYLKSVRKIPVFASPVFASREELRP
jgi:tryptophan 2,3-dioxygenase